MFHLYFQSDRRHLQSTLPYPFCLWKLCDASQSRKLHVINASTRDTRASLCQLEKTSYVVFIFIRRTNSRDLIGLCVDAPRRKKSSWETLHMGWLLLMQRGERKKERDEKGKGEKKERERGEREDYADESVGVTPFRLYFSSRCQSLANQFAESNWHLYTV